MPTVENMKPRHLKCGKCSFSTTHGALHLAKHLKQAHYKVENNKCPLCLYSFQTLGQIILHMKQKHEVKDVHTRKPKHLEQFKFKFSSSEENSKQSVDEQPTHEETWKCICDKCGKSFQKAWILLNHMACAHDINYQQAENEMIEKKVKIDHNLENVSNQYSSSSLEMLKSSLEKSDLDRVHIPEPIRGPGRPRKRKANLQIDQREDMGDKECEYKCKECTYETSHKQDMEDHGLVHGKKRKLLCAHCGSSFTQGHSLKYHLNAVHKMGE